MFQPLEPRILFALAPIGGGATVPTDGSVRTVDVAVGGDGSHLVVDFDTRLGGEEQVTAVRYGANGKTIGDPIILFTLPAEGDVDVAAAMDADGDTVVAYSVWNRSGSDTDLGDYAVYLVRISKAGVVSSPTQLDTLEATTNYEKLYSPAVSMDANGRFFVAWIEDVQRGSRPSDQERLIHFRPFDATGAPRAAEFTVDVSTPLSQAYDLELAARPDGSGAVFSYSVHLNDFDHGDVFGQVDLNGRVGNDGNAFGASSHDSSVAAFADGSFAVASTNIDTAGLWTNTATAYVQRYSANNQPIGPRIQLGTSLGGDGTGVSAADIVALPDGDLLVTFIRSTLDAGTGPLRSATNTLYVARYDAAGQLVEGPIAIDAFQSQASIDEQSVPINWRTDPINPGFPANAIAAAGGHAVVVHADAERVAHVQRLLVDPADVALIQNNVLYVFGTDGDDTITVTSGDSITVTRNGVEKTFSSDDVDVLDIDAFGGNDTVTNELTIKSTLRGGADDDTIFGGSGEDRIHGGVGDDSLWGRDGADKLFGEAGVDSLYGNGGNDRLEGGAQGDHMRGNGGRDMMFGNGGHDRMYGGPSGDRMYGQAGNDQIFGEGGNDRLYGDDGFVDSLFGGAGDDVFITLDDVIDRVFGDGGDDTANADPNDVLTSIAVET